MSCSADSGDRLSCIPRVNENITTRFLNDEAFIMDLESVRTFSLNESAARVWSCIDNSITVKGIIDRILFEYDVPGEVGRTAVLEILDRFHSEELIHFTHSA